MMPRESDISHFSISAGGTKNALDAPKSPSNKRTLLISTTRMQLGQVEVQHETTSQLLERRGERFIVVKTRKSMYRQRITRDKMRDHLPKSEAACENRGTW